jgi:serine/threonine protein phosphatase PrpC
MPEEIQQVKIAGYTDTGIRRAHNEDKKVLSIHSDEKRK